MEQINTVEEFIERIKNKLSVSRVDIKIKFEWDKQNSIKLRNADLSFADLRNAYLSFADLRNADLNNAYLSFANLSFADLRNADLNNANLSFANLSFADLRNAKGEFIFNFGVILKVVN